MLSILSKKLSQCCLGDSFGSVLIGNALFSSSQGRSTNGSFFFFFGRHFHVIDGVMSLALCCKWRLRFLNISDVSRSKPLAIVALPVILCARSSSLIPACPQQFSHSSLPRWMSNIVTYYFRDCSSTPVASLLNLCNRKACSLNPHPL